MTSIDQQREAIIKALEEECAPKDEWVLQHCDISKEVLSKCADAIAKNIDKQIMDELIDEIRG